MERNMYIILSVNNEVLADVFANTADEAARDFFNAYEESKRKRVIKIEKMFFLLNRRCG